VLIEVVWEDKKERLKKKQILTDKEECRDEYLEREIQIRDSQKKKKKKGGGGVWLGWGARGGKDKKTHIC